MDRRLGAALVGTVPPLMGWAGSQADASLVPWVAAAATVAALAGLHAAWRHG